MGIRWRWLELDKRSVIKHWLGKSVKEKDKKMGKKKFFVVFHIFYILFACLLANNEQD